MLVPGFIPSLVDPVFGNDNFTKLFLDEFSFNSKRNEINSSVVGKSQNRTKPNRTYGNFSLEFPPLSICVNIYALRLGSYYFNPTEYRGMKIAHPLCAGYKNRLLIYTYAQCDYANHDLALNWYM